MNDYFTLSRPLDSTFATDFLIFKQVLTIKTVNNGTTEETVSEFCTRLCEYNNVRANGD
jgi:hypothetical protein